MCNPHIWVFFKSGSVHDDFWRVWASSNGIKRSFDAFNCNFLESHLIWMKWIWMILNETESKSRKSLGQRFVARKLTFLIVSEGLTFIEGSILGSIKRNFDLDWAQNSEIKKKIRWTRLRSWSRFLSNQFTLTSKLESKCRKCY